MRPYSTVATKQPLIRAIRAGGQEQLPEMLPPYFLYISLCPVCSHNEWNKVSIQWAVSAAICDSKKNRKDAKDS